MDGRARGGRVAREVAPTIQNVELQCWNRLAYDYLCLGFGVEFFGFWGLGMRVEGSGFKVWGLGLRV